MIQYYIAAIELQLRWMFHVLAHTIIWIHLYRCFLVLMQSQAYHSDVPTAQKELIHRSWMRNETQVVVATIAFGLG